MSSNLREFRRRRGLTQVQLAHRVGLEQTYVSKLECGRIRNPSWEVVASIAATLGADPRDVFPVQPLEQAS